MPPVRTAAVPYNSIDANMKFDDRVLGMQRNTCFATSQLVVADWIVLECLQIENFYTVTSLAWKPDGSKLIVGSLTGAVDMYDACVKRVR